MRKALVTQAVTQIVSLLATQPVCGENLELKISNPFDIEYNTQPAWHDYKETPPWQEHRRSSWKTKKNRVKRGKR